MTTLEPKTAFKLWRPGHLRRALCTILLLVAILTPLPTEAAEGIVYDDALLWSWDNWSWPDPSSFPNFSVTSPVHSGSRSIGVRYTEGWQGVQLYYPGFSTGPFSTLRFYVHGGSSGGQRYRVQIRPEGNSPSGPYVDAPLPVANQWTRVDIPLAALGVENTNITRVVWQNATANSQPIFYMDDIAFVWDEDPNGPALSEGDVMPRAALPGDPGNVTIKVKVTDPQGKEDVTSVTVNGDAFGLGTITLKDDGRSNDGGANDGVYGVAFTLPADAPRGEYVLVAKAVDQSGHETAYSLGAFVVLAVPPAGIPSELPQRLGFGTDEWSHVPGEDWQVNSGVPWDYVYDWLTWSYWQEHGGPEEGVRRFVNQAWDKGYIPIVTVYLIDGATGCYEDAKCYASWLRSGSSVGDYLAVLREAARQANGPHPVIFHLEPDFAGFMQELSNRSDRPDGVEPDDPSSYYVALNVSGYPNNLTGFGRRMIDVIRSEAPNALVAHHASDWATHKTSQIVAASEIEGIAQRTADFLNAMGGDRCDLFFTEWSDRDAGSGERPWWDVSNREVPRPARRIQWDNALIHAAGQRLMLWMVPCGNMDLENVCTRYQDNRAEYIFHHLRDLADAGFAGVVFGPGTESCMTRPSTDGGKIRDWAATTYAPPAATGGLSKGASFGPTVPVRWDESSEPDLWGYRLTYEPDQGGATHSINVGRANATDLLLPYPGSWRVWVAVYDALSQLGPLSSPIVITTTESPESNYLPLVQRDR